MKSLNGTRPHILADTVIKWSWDLSVLRFGVTRVIVKHL